MTLINTVVVSGMLRDAKDLHETFELAACHNFSELRVKDYVRRYPRQRVGVLSYIA